MSKKNQRNTKGKIVSAAWKLFYEQGYDATTVGEQTIFLRYGDMEVSYWVTTGHQVIVNFAAKQDGVILYPDLIKVQMSLESGRVVGFEALNYLSSHQTRSNLTITNLV